MARAFLVLVLLLCAAAPVHARPPFRIPASPQELVERLPRGYARLGPAATRPQPLAQARDLLVAAATTGDARLAARAEAVLAASPRAAGSVEGLRLRAFAAQHRHDFATSVALLDRLLAQAPRDADARLSRAQVRLVQGHVDLARADCAALALGLDAADGMLCAAALSLRRGNTAAAAMLADRWLSAVPRDDPRRRNVLVLRAEAAARAGEADADDWYRRALAMDRGDVRTLASYARHLRSSGRPAAASALLADAPPSDGLLLQRALSAHAASSPDRDRLAAAIGRRYALARKLGATPELRDEAEYYLVLRARPDTALGLARLNFREQRDTEDAELLHRAATAARRADVVAELAAWSRERQLPVPGPGRAP